MAALWRPLFGLLLRGLAFGGAFFPSGVSVLPGAGGWVPDHGFVCFVNPVMAITAQQDQVVDVGFAFGRRTRWDAVMRFAN